MTRPIADHALLGDGHSAALVTSDGSVDWWCPERFDARSAFARILDSDAGHFSVRPSAPHQASRAYLEDSMVLQTTFTTAGGVLILTDALALEPGARGHDIGLRSPHVLLRLAEVVEGHLELEVEWAPRRVDGLVVPGLRRTARGVRTLGGADSLHLVCEVALELDGGTARATAALAAGDHAGFAVHHRAGLARTDFGESPDVASALRDTTAGWRSWAAEHVGYDGPYRDAVRRSSLVLQALTYGPSGALVAAPTTSLPEVLGGEANWDYRYAWLRDASLTLRALWIAACPTEGHRYFDWMAAAVGGGGESVQIMFGVEGERDLAERELDHLAGYAGSRPVRIGNAAWTQRQLDVMGEMLDAAFVLRDQLDQAEEGVPAFLIALADRAAADWREPDAGIWEARDLKRHYTSSKLMCWVALDRAVRLAPQLGAESRVQGWAATRDAIRADVLEQAFAAEAGVYAGAYGSDRLDASVLLMPIMGLVDAREPRMLATIDAIDQQLAVDGLVKRWTGTGADEGAFVICSFWLADCLARAGLVDRARAVFERVLGCANDVGLLAEEVDPRDGSQLGNFPQAFSHVGLITAAYSIQEAMR